MAYVRSAVGSGESVKYTVSIAPTVGHFLAVFVWQTEGAATPSAMTDNLGSVYTKDCDVTYNQGYGGLDRLTVYHLLNAPGGITGVSITPNKPSRGIVAEYSGMPTSGTVLDVCGAVNNQTTGVTSWSSTATTTTANDLVFGLADSGTAGNVGYGASGSWVGRATSHDNVDGDDSYVEDRIGVAVGSYTATGTTTVSATETAMVVAYKTSGALVAPAITSANATSFAVGTAGTFTVTATGTPAPTFSETGALPGGVTLSSAGILSGTPAAGSAGAYPITITAQNSVSPNATQSFTLTVGQAAAITSANNATFTAGTSGTFTVTATGTPAPTLSETGALPTGVTFTPATGVLTGTPTVGGTYAITFTAANGVGTNATQSFTLTVNQAPAITSANNTIFTTGTAGTFSVTATGTPAPTFSETGTLPSGVTFSAAGVLSGTAAAGSAGSYPITITAANGVGTNATQSFTVTVNAAAPPPVAYVRSAVGSGESVKYTVSIAPTAGDFLAVFVWQTEGAATPSAMTDNLGSVYTKDCDVTYNQGYGGLDRLTVYHLLNAPRGITGVSITPNKASRGIVAEYSGMPTSGTVLDVCGAVNNQTTGVTSWSSTATTTTANDLVFGLADSGTTGNVGYGASGSWVGRATSHDNVDGDDSYVEDRIGVAAGSYTATGTTTVSATETTLVVGYKASTVTLIAPAIISPVSAAFVVGAAGTFTVTATGTPVPTLSETGTLPAGVTFNASTGVLSGTPAAGTAGSYAITFGAQNGVSPNATQSFTLTVGQAPAINSASSATFTAGAAGTFTVTATGTPAPTLSETGALPTGVTFTPATGTLSGTPTVGGTFAITFAASNGVGTNATQSFTLTVNQAPAITSGNNTIFTTGTAGTFSVTATGTPAPTFSETGTLPSGVTFSAAGVLSGTAAEGSAGSYPITITAANGVGTNATQSFTLTVSSAPAITSANNTAFTVGTPGTFTVTATGTPAPTLSQSGTLPSGVTFTSTTGVLSGTPAAGTGGSYPITFTAANGSGTNATQSFTLTVNQAPAITSANNTIFTTGTAGTFSVTATGTPAPTFSETGTLPSGVIFSVAGVLSGTAASGSAGSYPIAITAANGVGTNATQSFTVTVNAAAPPPVAYVRSAVGSGESVKYTVSIAPTAGDFLAVFVFQTEGAATPSAMTDNLGSVYTKDCDVTYNQGYGGLDRLTVYHLLNAPSGITGVSITPNKPSRGIVAEYSGMPTSGTVLDVCGAANNQTTGVTSWSSTATTTTANDLVFGLADSGTTGNVGYGASGSWVGRATSHDNVDGDDSYVEDRIGVAAGSYTATGTTTVSATETTMVIAYKAGPALVAPAITSANAAAFTVGTSGAFTVTAIGYPVPSLSESGALPAGLTFNQATGALSGTPAAGTAGSYAITFGAQNGVSPNATQSFTVTVNQAPAIASANNATFAPGVPGTFTVVATGSPAPTLSETGTLPAGITFNSSTGVLSGTPAAGGTFAIMFTAANGIGSNATQSFTLTVNQAPIITSANNSMFTAALAGTFTVTATGLPVPSLSETGTLPTGVTFNASTGVLSGTPAGGTAGVYPITFVAQNGVSPNATQSFTLTVAIAPAITSANNTTFTAGTAGTFTVMATGTPTPTFSETGALPGGLAFSTAGVLSGTPAAGAAGSYPITITAQNGVAPNATQSFTLTVNSAPAITSANGTTFAVATAGTFAVTATGNPVPVFSETGALPDGVTLSPAGVLSGTPAAGTVGTFAITITAANGVAPSATQNFTLTVNQSPAITSANNTTFLVGTAGTFTVTATGTPAPTFSETGTLPGGVTLTAAGLLTGTPAAGSAGSYSVTITAANGVAPNATQSFTLTVNQAPAITSANNATFAVGSAGTFTVTATGLPAPTFSETGALPIGVTLSSAGVLSGIPAAGSSGSYPITITAQNGVAPVATQAFTLMMSSAPVITSAGNFTFVVGTAGTFTVTATGAPLPTFSETGTLPGGVALNAAGVLSGTPAAGSAGAYPITITAANGVGSNATQSFALTVNQAPSITSANNTTFAAGAIGTFTVTATGSPVPTFSETGALPSGVTLGPTGVLSGTAAAGSAGSYPIVITAQNGAGTNATQSFTLTVSLPSAPTIAYVRSAVGSGESVKYTVNIAPASGDFLTVFVYQTEGAATPSAMTDNLGSVYTKDCDVTYDQGYGGLDRLTVYHLLNAPGGITGVSITPNKPSRGIVAEYSGMPTSGTVLDVCGAVNNQTTGVTSWSSTATTTAANDLVFGLADSGTTGNVGYGASGSWVGRATSHDNVDGDDSYVEDRIGVAAGSYTATGTTTVSATETAMVVGYKTSTTPLVAPVITSTNNAAFTVGFAGSFAFVATGFPAPALSESGALPAGVTFNSATGALVGTPAAGTTGAYPITFMAQNGVAPNATQSFTLTVNQTAAITSINSSTFTVGSSGSFTVTATGAPAPALSESGALPTGVTFNPITGVLSGSPATGSATTYSIAFTAHNGVGMDATQSFTLTVNQTAAITSASTATFTAGSPVSFAVTASGSPAPQLSESGTLPSGLTFSAATGMLGGTLGAGTGGTYPITFIAHNGVGADATQSFTLIVNQAAAITSANSATFTVGSAGTLAVTATGFPALTLSETGTLPSGVSFVPSTGILSGTPAAGTGGTYAITFTAHNGVGADATQTFTLTVNQSAAFASANNATFLVGAAGTFTVTGTGYPALTLSESGTLPSGVTFTPSTGVLSGTPAPGTGGTYPITFTGHNGIGTDAIQTFTLTVNDVAAITSANSAVFTVGASGSFTVTATGFPAATLSETGTLPLGVTFNSASGTLSGTPASATGGTYPVTFTAHNGVGADAIQSFTLTVNQAAAITSANSVTYAVGAAGSLTITATGFPAATLSEMGTLPSGVTFNAATGLLSGTPAAGTGGAYSVAFNAHNGIGPDATQSFTLTVNQAASISSVNNATFFSATASSFTVTAAGFPVPALSESGALPSGVTFNPLTGTLAGTSTVTGTFPIMLTAHNGVGADATQNFTLTVSQAPSAPSIVSASSAQFTVALPGTFTVVATGSPAPTLSESGTLPAGVTFNSTTGVLAGTPASRTGGTYSIVFTAHNGSGPDATENFTLTVNQASAITSSSRTTFKLGTPGTFTVVASGFPAPAITETGAMPSGVTFNPTTGVLSGTPNVGTTGTYPIVFSAQNNVGAIANQNFTLTVNQSPTITSASTTTFTIGNANTFTLTATGSPNPTLSEVGTLPSGITFVNSTGVLSGMPAAGTAGNYILTFTAHNNAGTDATQSFTLIVGLAPVITSASNVTFSVGATNSFSVTATGDPMPTISEAGALPTGLAFNSASGILAGTAAAGTDGTYPITFTAHNGIAPDAIQNFTLTVSQSPSAPSINSPSGVTFVAGIASSFTVTSTGSPTPTLAVNGALPTGVTFNALTGVLSGTVPAGTFGVFPATFTAQNGNAPDAAQSFTLTVVSAPVITSQPANQTVNAGQAATFTAAATGAASLNFQWQRNSVNISGATSSTYTTPATTSADDQAQFSVTVNDGTGSASSTVAVLTVISPVSIAAQPAPQIVAVGESATFTVSVTGSDPLTYVWSRNGQPIANSNSSSYTTAPVTPADSGSQFSVVVSNVLGPVPSASASVTVVAYNSPAKYYVDAVSGSDTNDGISKDQPWENAPGMAACSFNCTAFQLQPGDQVIFKGGVTWQAGSFPMVIAASGTSANPIYFGVDQTWFSGNTWSRPVFDLYNSTWTVAPILVNASNFVTIDNLEIKNEAVDNSGSWPPRSSISVNAGSNIAIQNCYVHGWSIQDPLPGSDVSPSGGIAFYYGSVGGVVQNCVLDGSPESDSGVGIYGGTSVQGNIVENVPNGIVVSDPGASVSGNQVFDVPYSVDPSVTSNAILDAISGSVYNNAVHDLVPGAFALSVQADSLEPSVTQSVYNNLVWNVADNSPISVSSYSVASNQFIFNNTLSGGTLAGCVTVTPGYFPPTNLTVENNHCISELPASQAWCWNNAGGNFSCGPVANLIFGNNVLMTTEAAAAQGYSVANSFQPPASSAATVGAGLNLIPSCVTIGSPLCNDRLGVARPSGSLAWDAGAYQYQAVTGTLAPVITTQPVRLEVLAGHSATFNVVATGSGQLTYQWRKNGAPISGAVSPSYTSPAVLATDDGSVFAVIVSNAYGSVTSSPALLSVSSTPGSLIPSATSLAFGNVNIGTANAASVTFTNSSASYVTIANVGISGAGFTASGIPSGLILAPTEVATLNVTFAPSGAGSVAGSVTIAGDAAGSPITIPLSATGLVALHSATLTWNPSTSAVFGYNVYRAPTQFGPYTKLNSTPVPITQFTDLTVQSGQTYMYWVTSVDANTVESGFSSPVMTVIPTP